jgi:hypothetical protein
MSAMGRKQTLWRLKPSDELSIYVLKSEARRNVEVSFRQQSDTDLLDGTAPLGQFQCSRNEQHNRLASHHRAKLSDAAYVSNGWKADAVITG